MDDTELNNAIYDYVNLSYETPENDATQRASTLWLSVKAEA